MADPDLSRRIVYDAAGMTDVDTLRRIVYKREDDTDLLMDLYRPRGGGPGLRRPAIIFVHGGPIPKTSRGTRMTSRLALCKPPSSNRVSTTAPCTTMLLTI